MDTLGTVLAHITAIAVDIAIIVLVIKALVTHLRVLFYVSGVRSLSALSSSGCARPAPRRCRPRPGPARRGMAVPRRQARRRGGPDGAKPVV